MGAKNTKTSTQTATSAMMDHSNFATACRVGEGSEACLETTMSLDEGVWSKWKNELTNAGLKDEFLMLPKSNEYSSKGLCGTSGILKLKFPDHPYLLKDQIAKRAEHKQWFEQSDLWFLLDCLLSAQKEVWEKKGTKLGDVRPTNVFISEGGDVKVSTLLSWPGEMTNCSKALEKESTYLSPEEVKRLATGEAEKPSDICSELFSIGLTILSSAMLTDCSVIYSNTTTIDWTHYETLMSQWKGCNRYSEIFRSLICNLCCCETDHRLTCPELWTWISTYNTPIQFKENFFITSVPAKLEREVANLKMFLSKWSKPQQESWRPVPTLQSPPHVVPWDQNRPQENGFHPMKMNGGVHVEQLRQQPLQFIGNTHQVPTNQWKSPNIPTLTQVHLEGTTGQNENWEHGIQGSKVVVNKSRNWIENEPL